MLRIVKFPAIVSKSIKYLCKQSIMMQRLEATSSNYQRGETSRNNIMFSVHLISIILFGLSTWRSLYTFVIFAPPTPFSPYNYCKPISICLTQHRLAHQLGSSLLPEEVLYQTLQCCPSDLLFSYIVCSLFKAFSTLGSVGESLDIRLDNHKHSFLAELGIAIDDRYVNEVSLTYGSSYIWRFFCKILYDTSFCTHWLSLLELLNSCVMLACLSVIPLNKKCSALTLTQTDAWFCQVDHLT